MKCPRCVAGSLVASHATISCLSCGHAVSEPAMQAWDNVTTVRDRTRHRGPAWTEGERALWRAEAAVREGESEAVATGR